MLLQSLRALCKVPGGAGSIKKYSKALARATGVSGRFAYGFQTELHFTDEVAICAENVVVPTLGVGILFNGKRLEYPPEYFFQHLSVCCHGSSGRF